MAPFNMDPRKDVSFHSPSSALVELQGEWRVGEALGRTEERIDCSREVCACSSREGKPGCWTSSPRSGLQVPEWLRAALGAKCLQHLGVRWIAFYVHTQ